MLQARFNAEYVKDVLYNMKRFKLKEITTDFKLTIITNENGTYTIALPLEKHCREKRKVFKNIDKTQLLMLIKGSEYYNEVI